MPGLDPFYAAFNDPKTIDIVCIGDSTTYGISTTNTIGWPGALRSLAAARWGATGSDGVHVINDRNFTPALVPGVYYSGTAGSYDGVSWKEARNTDVWDRSLAEAGGSFSKQGTYLGSTSSMIATWTKPSYLTVNGFYIWTVDGPSSGNFSYSTDGGTTWINVSATWNQDNTLKRILINTTITGTNTVKIRGANAAGTSVNCYLLGLEPVTVNSTFTIHNFGASGMTSSVFARSSSGNWHQILDQLQPQLVTYMMTNDAALTAGFGVTDVSSWRSNIEAIANVVTGYGGSMLFLNFFEQLNRGTTETIGDTAQANYRAMVKDVAASYGMPCVDFYDLVGDGKAAIDAGYIAPGSPNPYTGPTTLPDIHPTDAGAAFMAQQIWKVIGRPYRGSRFRT